MGNVILYGDALPRGYGAFYPGHHYLDEHGRKVRSREFNSYYSMLQRCYNPRATNYAIYGGRGIRVCWQWVAGCGKHGRGFECFLRDMGSRPIRMSLDRTDPESHYHPDNCTWATALHQTRNRRVRQC